MTKHDNTSDDNYNYILECKSEGVEIHTCDNTDLLERMNKCAKEAELYRNIISKCVSKRKRLKITQEALSEKTGINSVTISRIEKLTIKPKITTLVTLMNHLNLQIKIVDID